MFRSIVEKTFGEERIEHSEDLTSYIYTDQCVVFLGFVAIEEDDRVVRKFSECF